MQEIEKAKEEFLSKIWKTKPKDYDFALSPYLQNDKNERLHDPFKYKAVEKEGVVEEYRKEISSRIQQEIRQYLVGFETYFNHAAFAGTM